MVKNVKDIRAFAFDFITENRAAALATVDGSSLPHVAYVYCAPDKSLNVYFSTRAFGQKFENLLNRPNVAMAFSNEESLTTIQLQGVAERVDDVEQEQSIMHELLVLRYNDPNWPLPPMQLFEKGFTNEVAVIKITPSRMTLADFSDPDKRDEGNFFQTII